MNFDEITVNDWEAFVANNESIKSCLEYMVLASLEVEETTKALSEYIQDAYTDFGKLKKIKLSKTGNLDSLYTILQSYQQLLTSKIGESAIKIFYGILCAEQGISNYNIDIDTKTFMNDIINGKMNSEDGNALAFLLSSYSPLIAYSISRATNERSPIGTASVKGTGAIGRKLIEEGFSTFLDESAYELFKNTIGSSSAAFTAAGVEMVLKYIYNDLDPSEYDAKDWIEVGGKTGAAVAEYFISAALVSEFGPVGIPIGIGINLIINKIIEPTISFVGDMVTGNVVADTFIDSDHKEYTIYYNGSGNHMTASEILKNAKGNQSVINNIYKIKGRPVSKTQFESELYGNTDIFMKNELKYSYTPKSSSSSGTHISSGGGTHGGGGREITSSSSGGTFSGGSSKIPEGEQGELISGGMIYAAPSYDSYSDVWNQMTSEIRNCESANDVYTVYNKYKNNDFQNGNEFRWQTTYDTDGTELDVQGIYFSDVIDAMEREYDFDPVKLWEYTRES